MTVTYTAKVATCRGLGCFLQLLRRWRGSIYKLVWMDLLLFLLMYYGINIIYRFLLNEHGKEQFESVVKYCKEYSNLIPLSFVLGFYVSIVMMRWWNQYTAIPFPDTIALFVSTTVHGQDERGRVMRRTIMRYVCLCVTMMFTMIAPRVKKRFPTLDHFVEAGLLQESEKSIFQSLNIKFPNYSKHWLPLVWAASIITRARKEGRIRDDFAVKTIIDELNKFRAQCGVLLSYDNISVPLVYTQVVTLAVYSYFLTTLMGHQWVESDNYKFDLYFPVFTTLQFFFYVGWLKVAESLINPFGEDDDDFEVNWMVDRNLAVSYLIVDEMHHEHPELVRDQYWDEIFPQELPYPPSAEPFRESHPLPSTANIGGINTDVFGPSSIKIDDGGPNDMFSGPITFTAKTKSNRGSQSSIQMPKTRGSQSSMQIGNSIPDSLPRTSSVTNMLKRFFSREDSKNDSTILNKPESPTELTQLNPNPKYPGSIKKITDEVIEEVDEQTTIHSMRETQESKPTVMEIFGPPPPSKPIDVPNSLPNTYDYSGDISIYDPFPPMSVSAPHQSDVRDNAENISINSSDSGDDDFEQLKRKRDEERMSRLKLNLLKSVSSPTEEFNESEMLLKRRRSSTQITPKTPTSTPRSSLN